MERIRVKEIIDFRRKSSDRSKKAFANTLKTRKPKIKSPEEKKGGGDYWISSRSCIYNVFRENNKALYDLKIDELHSKREDTDHKGTKDMFQKNIEILNNFKDFEFESIKPNYDLTYIKVSDESKIITVDSFPLFVDSRAVFSYERNDKIELGALWLVTIKHGYKKEELGIFCEMLYAFLQKNYSDDYQLSPDHCVVIDTFSGRKVTYSELLNGDVPFLIEGTLKEIKRL